ncbi:MAG TPA: hypothetical protein VGK83_10155 [Acidimicrobiia bacterium]
MSAARWAAIVLWIYSAGFGIPAVPIGWYLLAKGRLPMVFGLFPAYGGPWSARLGPSNFVALLVAFLLVTILAAFSGWLLWNGSRVGAILALALLPLEAVFWFGFALPIPPILAAVRIALIASAWRSLS